MFLSSKRCKLRYLCRRMLSVHPVPAWRDNYMYVIVDDKTKEAALVDAVEPKKILNVVTQLNCTVTAVLTTHHHADHSGGNQELSDQVSVPFYGGDDRIPMLSNTVDHGDKFKIGGLSVECLSTPCHTSGHICYYVTDDNNEKAVFTGDTLFIGGCGRFFEGTPAQMCRALMDVLYNLPDKTKVYCGHEYTVQNLLFAKSIEPKNKHVTQKLEWAQKQRENKLPTIPSTIGEEKEFNPFMRVTEASIKQATKASDPETAMRYLREAKNNFK